jgi:hypothetical protein
MKTIIILCTLIVCIFTSCKKVNEQSAFKKYFKVQYGRCTNRMQ